jgi:hypothetical protein
MLLFCDCFVAVVVLVVVVVVLADVLLGTRVVNMLRVTFEEIFVVDVLAAFGLPIFQYTDKNIQIKRSMSCFITV